MLKALRRLLFLSCEEAARLVTAPAVTEGQWRGWECGVQPADENAMRRILELVDWRSTALAAMADAIRQQINDKGVPEAVFIIWYDRLEDWCSLPGRDSAMWRVQQSVCAALAGMFQTVRLVPFDAQSYARWLSGRDDSESLRAEWASTENDQAPH